MEGEVSEVRLEVVNELDRCKNKQKDFEIIKASL